MKAISGSPYGTNHFQSRAQPKTRYKSVSCSFTTGNASLNSELNLDLLLVVKPMYHRPSKSQDHTYSSDTLLTTEALGSASFIYIFSSDALLGL